MRTSTAAVGSKFSEILSFSSDIIGCKCFRWIIEWGSLSWCLGKQQYSCAEWGLNLHQIKLVFMELNAFMLARPVTLQLVSELDSSITSSVGKSAVLF